MGDNQMVLPPGFEFDPTDEELIVYFLCPRAANLTCYPNIIPDLDIHGADPCELNEKAFSGKGGWYFFGRSKQDRSTGKGFWKEIGLNEPIFTNNGDEVGKKNYLVFYYGDQVGSMVQTNWIMQEYHLLKSGNTAKKSYQMGENQIQDMNEWVICRVHDQANLVDSQEKNYDNNQSTNSGDGVELSYLDEVFISMEDEQEEITFPSYY